MPDNVFIDTNLIIYSYSNNDQIREIIEDIFNGSIIIISTQVLNETANILLKKMKIGEDKIIEVIEELREKFQNSH